MKNSSSFFHNAKASVALWLNNFLGIDQKIREATKDSIRTDQVEGLAREVSSLKEKLTPAKVAKIVDPNLFHFPEKSLKIRVSNYVTKDKKVFFINRSAWTTGRPIFSMRAPIGDSPRINYTSRQGKSASECSAAATPDQARFLRKIFDSELVTEIDAHNSFEFILEKSGAETWEEILPKLTQVIASTFEDAETSTLAEESSSQE